MVGATSSKNLPLMIEFAAFVVSNQCITKETAGVREREDEQNGRRVDEK